MASSADIRLVVTSEHGSARVPARYRHLFRDSQDVFSTHRALDIGSAELAAYLGRRAGVPVHRAPVTRLLVDCNRSPGHPGVFSEFSRRLSAGERRELLEHYYRPYRDGVEAAVAHALADGNRVVHISVHTFTRTLHGVERNADIGLLYDPARRAEKALCLEWQALLTAGPGLRVRRNYPYRGVADGLVTALRRRHPGGSYIGVEFEACQDIAEKGGERWRVLKRRVADSLMEITGTSADPSGR